MTKRSVTESFRRGDLVEVRSAAEIIATLDDIGCLDSLPFMSEMIEYCGRQFLVERRADKVCDTIGYSGSREIRAAVLLDDLRCDGAGHGGCQAECRFYWKEAWLRKVDSGTPIDLTGPTRDEGKDALEKAELARRCARNARPAGDTEESHYSCQATDVLKASSHISRKGIRVNVREYTSGDVDLGTFVKVMARAVVREPLVALKVLNDVPLRGPGKTSPKFAPLDLEPGEWVRVRSPKEIEATLNNTGKHRGLHFDREMLRFCGKTFRVHRRVTRIIDERTGEIINLGSDCIVLDGAYCSGEASTGRWFCPRAIFSYWRECWLERVSEPAAREPVEHPVAISTT